MKLDSVTLAALPIRWEPWVENDPVAAVLDCLRGHASPSTEPPLHILLGRSGREQAPLPDGAHPLFFHGRTRVFRADDGSLLFHDGHSLLTLSEAGDQLRGGVSDASLHDGHTFSQATLLIALAVALRLRGRFHLHAGLISTPGLGTVLIAGDAAHGKSTTTLGLLQDGGYLAGDDTLYLHPEQHRIWSLPKPLNLSPATAAAFASRTASVEAPRPAETGKRAYPAERLFPGAVTTSLPYPDLLLFPRVTGEPSTTLLPMAPADTLGGLMTASALVAVDGLPRGEEHLAALGALLTAQAYELRLGRDALDDPGIPGRLLHAAAG